MSITLQQILSLAGPLDDTTGPDTPRERFRQFLRAHVTKVGEVRDYIEECLRTSGQQYSRALQDLVNYLGHFLGFTVRFGRYQGVPGQIGFDGHWQSPSGFHLVVEVKTSETYAIKTATLTHYVDTLISERQIPDWDHALGLYVVGRPDPELRQLEHAITAERRTHQLRIISVESLLSLAELMNEYDVSHDDVLAVLRPSRPTIDPVVDLMARLVAQRHVEPVMAPESVLQEQPQTLAPQPIVPTAVPLGAEVAYWLTPVKADDVQTAEEVIHTLVGREGMYAFSERTPGRKHLKPGDWIAFYATGKGVVAHAQVMSTPAYQLHPCVRHAEQYPWVFLVGSVRLYVEEPMVIDAGLRSQLEAFHTRDATTSWAWFVQSTRRVTAHDFEVLTWREVSSHGPRQEDR
jgi:hypothetical protein